MARQLSQCVFKKGERWRKDQDTAETWESYASTAGKKENKHKKGKLWRKRRKRRERDMPLFFKNVAKTQVLQLSFSFFFFSLWTVEFSFFFPFFLLPFLSSSLSFLLQHWACPSSFESLSPNGVEEVGRVNLNIDEDVEHVYSCSIDRDKATVSIMHQQVRPQRHRLEEGE